MTKRPHRARDTWRSVVAAAAFIVAIGVLVLATRPSPRLSLASHWQVFGLYALGAAGLMVVASWASRRYRWLVATISIVALVVAALAHPVCVPIPKADQSSFEKVTSLEQRARQGEPFCRFGTKWYQCKSVLSRAFFF